MAADMNVIADNLRILNEKICVAASASGRKGSDVKLLAVTKGQALVDILKLKELGQKNFGENRIQEALPKIAGVGTGVEWHMIGHLQTNKVREAVTNFSIIQSVDSMKLAKAISFEASKQNKVMDLLLEINAAGEAQKYGFVPESVYQALEEASWLPNIKIKGLMGMAPNSPDPNIRRETFKILKNIFSVCKSIKKENISMQFLSMGMSDDYPIAIEEGANLVRIGRALFHGR